MLKLISIIILIISFSSCSLNPPEWLHGRWNDKNDTLKKEQNFAIWNINEDGIFVKTDKNDSNEIKSTSMITMTEIIEENRYIIRADHALEDIPIFEIFRLNENNEITYYDSMSLMPRH